MSANRHVSRRQFLKSAAVVIGGPYLLSSTAWGRSPPSSRINVALIGIGNQGGGHLHNLVNHRDFQLRAVCDVDRTKRENARKFAEDTYAAQRGAAEYRGCDLYNNFEDVLARDDLDAVVIAVPDHWHAVIAIAACRAGLDVYCEKPLSLTVREAEAMVRAARRYGRIFQTGSQQRSESGFRVACELVRSGRIGKLQKVNVGVDGPSSERYLPEEPVPDGFDWNRWLGPAPQQPFNRQRCSGDYGGGWRLIRDYSGGMMTDWGAHHFDIAQWGLGMDGSGPVEIIPPNVAEAKTLTYRYADGLMMYHGGANGILFTGTDGRVEVNRGYLKTWPDEIGKEPLGPNDVHLYESPGHYEDWVNCIRERRPPICDVAIGASSVTVCHLGNVAWWLGRTIRWDPEKHEIVGDEAASRWLDRPKRAPWRL